jgi:hypothetical protein
VYIYTNGCSMTYGSELHDDPVTQVCTDHEYRWRYSWPGRLRGLLDADGVYNDAVPSGSNDRIVRTTIDFVARWSRLGLPVESLLMVVGWTHPARREFFVTGDYRQVVPHHSYDIRALNRLVARYRSVATSAEEAAERYVTQVAALRGFLDQQGISFLFFNGVAEIGLPEHLTNSCVEEAFTDGRFLDHDAAEPTMAEFLRGRPGTSIIAHPNETGHQLWAERIAREIDPARFKNLGPDQLAAAQLPALGGTQVARRHDRKGAERLTKLVRTRLIRMRIRRGDSSDSFIYP